MRDIGEIDARLSQLEESLAAENRTFEDFPEILMQNLREQYGYGSGDRWE